MAASKRVLIAHAPWGGPDRGRSGYLADVADTLPVLVSFLLVQKRLTTGLVKGAVKG